MPKYTLPRLKLGCASCLLLSDYVSGARFAAERCADVALQLLMTGERGEHLPLPGEIREIGAVCRGEGADLHVHLPTDAHFGSAREARKMVEHVRRAVDIAAPLAPHSFVLHVDFPELQRRPGDTAPRPALNGEQRARTAEALAEIAAFLPAPELLAVENLEFFPVDFWDPWLKGAPYSRCLDVGHIWKDGGDPVPALEAWLPRARVIHLHGLQPDRTRFPAGPPIGPLSCLADFGPRPRDHKSLALMPPARIDAVLHRLWDRNFAGALNLEVFNPEDFVASHAALLQSWERHASRPPL